MNSLNLTIVILTIFVLLFQIREYVKFKQFDYLDKLIRKNSEHIAALIVQTKLIHQRLTELTFKTDKIQERI
ncbi:MAG: hypothetical protein COZ46_07570 [Verrucomicrobia bacterium CG_4_10_14_3_um_filter_43_23]|nr:MAG: hypothetical protein AUJ82_03215 [Verrucomicrobia bacterium CG1_02_43_26]PIP59705.1 MAG: hypothetical protein COX01_02045 [Verrucomicrobia bacterium CG22_combo_CG10-13_8_21_14_all_43_17]PIX57717.1 MAG: hypothetical protein COZ46_07570 [Verrucomicrobia bacterium CG_4_10_14_3_um_filter_43_23]PIY62509.1 MAG: hypothetical protein COY94_01755 [Verrucomicrobia bacterium CG_4_10_14_0_8_um_filter_43_34]PJA44671.1 MAG: hypothetical protein CO175_01870 [Verrucomicrobia bacterium CG_4_9_14_3_um_fi